MRPRSTTSSVIMSDLERIGHAAVPHVVDAEGYRAFPRMELSKVAVEGALADGVLDEDDSGVLTGLRAKLGISDDDHMLMLQDVRKAAAGS